MAYYLGARFSIEYTHQTFSFNYFADNFVSMKLFPS